jgi:hypothetical protein
VNFASLSLFRLISSFHFFSPKIYFCIYIGLNFTRPFDLINFFSGYNTTTCHFVLGDSSVAYAPSRMTTIPQQWVCHPCTTTERVRHPCTTTGACPSFLPEGASDVILERQRRIPSGFRLSGRATIPPLTLIFQGDSSVAYAPSRMTTIPQQGVYHPCTTTERVRHPCTTTGACPSFLPEGASDVILERQRRIPSVFRLLGRATVPPLTLIFQGDSSVAYAPSRMTTVPQQGGYCHSES